MGVRSPYYESERPTRQPERTNLWLKATDIPPASNADKSHEVFLFTHPLHCRLGTITAHRHLCDHWPDQWPTVITAV